MFAERLLRAWHGTGVEGNKTGRFPLQEPRVLPAEGTENRPAGPGPGRTGNDPRSGAGPQGPPAEGRPEPCRRLPAGAEAVTSRRHRQVRARKSQAEGSPQRCPPPLSPLNKHSAVGP